MLISVRSPLMIFSCHNLKILVEADSFIHIHTLREISSKREVHISKSVIFEKNEIFLQLFGYVTGNQLIYRKIQIPASQTEYIFLEMPTFAKPMPLLRPPQLPKSKPDLITH